MAQFNIPERDKTSEMRYQMGWKLSDLASENPDIRIIDADLRSSTGIHIFEHNHPDKLVKVGIAEQNMASIAAGLSQEGLIPFTCTFDSFSRRYMDQLFISIAYNNLNVKMIGAYAGLFTGKAGATHQSDRELSFILRVPNLIVLEPGTNEEMRRALEMAVAEDGPFYLRIVRCGVPESVLDSASKFDIGRGVTIWDEGCDIGLVSTGVMLNVCIAAAENLGKEGIKVRLDHHPSLKPFDTVLLDDMASKTGAIVTCENHCKSGGLFSIVAEHLVKKGCPLKIGAIGSDINDFIHTGHVNDLMAHYKMTSDDIVKKVKEILK